MTGSSTQGIKTVLHPVSRAQRRRDSELLVPVSFEWDGEARLAENVLDLPVIPADATS